MINTEFPAVTLFVDGVTYEPYLVTDDWPIHTAKIDTQLTVGACWQGQLCVCAWLCVGACVCLSNIHSSLRVMQTCVLTEDAEKKLLMVTTALVL